MNIFICFTGQGSQKTGMCADFLNHPNYHQITKNIFDQANEILGYNIGEIMLDSEKNPELNQTINTQPAIGINAEIIWSILKNELNARNSELLKNVKFMAGHSVGEYNALSASGILNFQTKLLLLKTRAKAMNNASECYEKSAMIAILGAEIEQIKKIIEVLEKDHGYKVEIANDNGANQIVLSGTVDAIDFISKNYKDLCLAKAIKLNVSGGFHSSFMEVAKIQFEKDIENISMNACNSNVTPVISNVTGELFPENNLIEMKKLLCAQITSTVNWRKTMDFIFSQNIRKIIEIDNCNIQSNKANGPSPVLINLAKKHFANNFECKNENEKLETHCIQDVESLENFLMNEI